MKKKSTAITSRKVKVTAEARALYAQRDSNESDPENPVLPPEVWERHGVIGKYYRPVKKLTTVRLDADVIEWLKSKGDGHLTRINEILRREMLADR